MSDVMTPPDVKAIPPDSWPALLDARFVCRETGFCKTTIYTMMADDPPAFPIARKAGKATVWIASEIWTWIHTRPPINVGKKATVAAGP